MGPSCTCSKCRMIWTLETKPYAHVPCWEIYESLRDKVGAQSSAPSFLATQCFGYGIEHLIHFNSRTDANSTSDCILLRVYFPLCIFQSFSGCAERVDGAETHCSSLRRSYPVSLVKISPLRPLRHFPDNLRRNALELTLARQPSDSRPAVQEFFPHVCHSSTQWAAYAHPSHYYSSHHAYQSQITGSLTTSSIYKQRSSHIQCRKEILPLEIKYSPSEYTMTPPLCHRTWLCPPTEEGARENIADIIYGTISLWVTER